MNNRLLFVLGCIPSRLLLANYVYENKVNMFVTLIPAIGFLYLYFTNSRMNAPEGNGITWWHSFRLLHGLLYLLTSYLIYTNDNRKALPLFLDTVIGLVLWINKYYL